MLGDISGARQIYIVTGYTDMRKSIDVLCAIIEEQFSMASASTVAWIMYQKYVNAMPLYRIEKDFRQNGVHVTKDISCVTDTVVTISLRRRNELPVGLM